MSVLVHRQLAGADDRFLFGLHRATEDGLDACHDLVEAERLGDVVVASRVESLDLVVGVVLGGEEQDGARVPGSAEALGDAEPVHVGEHDVENDEVWLLLDDSGDRGGAVADGTHHEPCEAQAGRQEFADVWLVVNNENLGAISHGLSILTPSE